MARDYTADDWCWTWLCDLSDAVCWRGRGRCGHCGNYGRRIAPARAAVPTAGIARPSLRSATPGGSLAYPGGCGLLRCRHCLRRALGSIAGDLRGVAIPLYIAMSALTARPCL